MTDTDPATPKATSVAPLIGLRRCSFEHGYLPIFPGLDLVSPPRIQVDEVWQKKLGDSAMEEMNGAVWALQYNYDGRPHEHLDPLETKADEILKRAQVALWIAQPTGASIRYILRYRDPWHDTNAAGISRHQDWIKPNEIHERNEIRREDLEHLRTICQRVQDVFERKLPLRRSLYHLSGALHMWFWDARFAMFTVVLESLFSTDSQEITHKISERVAWFLAEDGAERRLLYDRMKSIYRVRSKIVHGAEITKLTSDESRELLSDLETLTQRSFRKIMEDEVLFAVFRKNNEKRGEFLTSLIFS